MAYAPFSSFQGEFDSLARQYWNTWNELLGRGGGTDPWSLMGGLPPGMGRMDPGAFEWFSRMQQLAGRFSDGGSAPDITRAWREMLGGDAAQPFAGMLHAMHGGLAGHGWLDQAQPILDMLLRPLRQQGTDWLHRPAFGPAREHQERLQALGLAWQQWEERNEAFNALLMQAGQEAFVRFERLLGERDVPGQRVESARALFDLWIDAAEEAWAEVAMSTEYRHAYAEMTNALMRLRLGLQREVEQFGTMLGLPGRSELDALHRKVAELDRALHAARRAAAPAARPATARKGRTGAAQAMAPEAADTADAPGIDAHVTPEDAPVTAASRATPSQPRTRKPAARTQAAAAKKARTSTARKTAGKAAVKKAAAKTSTAAARLARASAARAPSLSADVAPAPRHRTAAAPAAVPAATPKKAAKARRVAAPATSRAASKTVAKSAAATASKTAAKSPTRAAPGAGKKAVAGKTRAKSVPARSPAARPTPVGAKARPVATTGTAAKTAIAAAGPNAGGRVVSMKDWVSRNLGSPEASAGAPGRKRGGRGT